MYKTRKTLPDRECWHLFDTFPLSNNCSLRLSSHKLAIVTGKWYKIEKELRLCNLCNLDAIEDEFHFLLNCDNFSELRNSTFQEIQRSENIDLSKGNPIKTLRDLFSKGSLHSLHVLGKFIKASLEAREKSS